MITARKGLPLTISLAIFMALGLNGFTNAKINSIAAFFSAEDAGHRVVKLCNEIIKDESLGAGGLKWLIPQIDFGPADAGGVFIRPNGHQAERLALEELKKSDITLFIKYHLIKAEIETKRNVSVPYILNRFSRLFSVEISYEIVDISSMNEMGSGSFDFEFEIDDHAQILEYDPWRADLQISALIDEKVINRAAAKTAELILEHLRSLKEELNSEVSSK